MRGLYNCRCLFGAHRARQTLIQVPDRVKRLLFGSAHCWYGRFSLTEMYTTRLVSCDSVIISGREETGSE